MTQEEGTDKTVVKNQDLFLLGGSILLGLLFDILFFKKSLGISYLLFVIVFYIIFLGLLHHKIALKFNFGWFLTIPIIALSSTYFIFSNRIFATLNFIFIPILIITQTILITRENKYRWFDIGFIDDILHGFFTRSFSYISNLFTIDLSSLTGKKTDKKGEVTKKILIGLVISFPLLIIILLLLSSADLVFNHLLDQMVIWFKNLNLGDFIAQVFLFFVIGMISFSYLWSFLKSNKNIQTVMSTEKSVRIGVLDPIITITVLSLVNFVYLAFVTVQFAYMFGAIKNGLPTNYTYAEYARKGFFELLTVTLINFTILLIGITFKPKGGKAVDRTMKILHTLLVMFTMVILVSAFSRMSLYEAAFGYTYLRVLTHSFMMLLFILFLVVLFKIWNDQISLLKSYIVISLIAYMVINFANIDALITKKNINRYIKTKDMDTQYLTELSYDSIPTMVNLFMEKGVPHDLLLFIDAKHKEFQKEQDWQSFSVSRFKAEQAILRYKTRKPVIIDSRKP
jgi:hypothetical protein